MTPAQTESFRKEGFLRLGAIAAEVELDLLRRLCDRALDKWRAGTMKFSSLSGKTPDSLVTVVSPEATEPELKRTRLAETARQAAAALYNCAPDAILMGWRIFLKRPGADGTPWHQDAAYRPPPHIGASMFVPLDSVDSEVSCMRYSPGSHLLGLRPHVLEHGHFAAKDPDSGATALCPLRAGEAVIHHCLTLHATGPHEGALARRAFAIVFQPQIGQSKEVV